MLLILSDATHAHRCDGAAWNDREGYGARSLGWRQVGCGMEPSRRELLKKGAVAAGVVWTTPMVTSVVAGAQSSGSCPLDLSFLQFECLGGSTGATWTITNLTAAPVWYQTTTVGCGLNLSGGPSSLPGSGSVNLGATQSPPQDPCSLTFTVQALTGPAGSIICTLSDTADVDCS